MGLFSFIANLIVVDEKRHIFYDCGNAPRSCRVW
jgi:hypothetical protein